MPVTLREALKLCEEVIHSKCRNAAVYNLSRFSGIDNAGCVPLVSIYPTCEDYFQAKGIRLQDILKELKLLGLSDENIERLKGTSLRHAYYVLNKLKNDVALTPEQLLKAMHLYKDVELLSKRDWPTVKRNEPEAVALTESPKPALYIECVGFYNLTPTDQKAFKAEILDMVDKRIQEYLQKTKSKGTSQKLAS